MTETRKTIRDLLQRAAKDKVFTQNLLDNPAQFRDEYQLDEEQMNGIRGAALAAQKVSAYAYDNYEDIGLSPNQCSTVRG